MCQVWLLISVQSGKEEFSTKRLWKWLEPETTMREKLHPSLSLSLVLVLSPFPLFLFSLSFLPPAPVSLPQYSLSSLLSFNLSFSTFKKNTIQTKTESLVMMEKFCRHKPMQVLLFPLIYWSSKNHSCTTNCFFFFSALVMLVLLIESDMTSKNQAFVIL